MSILLMVVRCSSATRVERSALRAQRFVQQEGFGEVSRACYVNETTRNSSDLRVETGSTSEPKNEALQTRCLFGVTTSSENRSHPVPPKAEHSGLAFVSRCRCANVVAYP